MDVGCGTWDVGCDMDVLWMWDVGRDMDVIWMWDAGCGM